MEGPHPHILCHSPRVTTIFNSSLFIAHFPGYIFPLGSSFGLVRVCVLCLLSPQHSLHSDEPGKDIPWDKRPLTVADQVHAIRPGKPFRIRIYEATEILLLRSLDPGLSVFSMGALIVDESDDLRPLSHEFTKFRRLPLPFAAL